MTPSLLPTELIENIAESLDLHSFRSFRLVCSSLNQQSLHTFKGRFLRTRTVKWNIESLRQLEAIACHAHFGKSLENLVIDATPRFAIQLWGLEREINQAAAQQDIERRNFLKAKHAELKEQAEKAAKYWIETRRDQQTLISVFGRVQSLKSITFAYDGMDQEHQLFGRRYCESSQNEMSRPFVSTLAAFAMCNLTVYSMAIDPERSYGAVSIGRLELIAPILAKFCDAFLKLTVLKLNLRDWRHPDEGFELPVGRAPFVVRFLSKFKNIHTLELSCFSCLEEDILSEMAKECVYPRMENCSLDLLMIRSVDDLFTFLKPAKSSLRSLRLSHIVLRDEAVEWGQVLRRIASDLLVAKVVLSSLFMKRGARVGFEGTLRDTLLVEGSNFKEELEAHADDLVGGNWGPAWHSAAVAYPFIGPRM